MAEDIPISRPDDARLPQSVLDIEEFIRFAPIESLYAVRPDDGQIIFSKSGNKDSIYLTDEECLLLEGNIVTHNHPFDEYPISVSFSEDDVLCAAAHGAAEVRAVTPTDKFSIRPPRQGWNLNYCFDVLLPAIEAAKPQVQVQMSSELRAGLMSEPEADRTYCHRLWSVLAPQLGLTYESSFSLEQLRQVQQSPVQETQTNNVIENEDGDTTFRLTKASFKEKVVREEAVKRLSDQKFLLLHQSVTEYFKTSLPSPPSQADKQLVQIQIDRLSTELDELWVQQASQVQRVESMQKNPFRAWNKEYGEAVEQIETTMGLISQSVAKKEQKEHQIEQWNHQAKVYQAWQNDPRTTEMKGIALVFKLPQMLSRLTNIRQELHRQARERLAGLRQIKQQQQRDHNQGLSL